MGGRPLKLPSKPCSILWPLLEFSSLATLKLTCLKLFFDMSSSFQKMTPPSTKCSHSAFKRDIIISSLDYCSRLDLSQPCTLQPILRRTSYVSLTVLNHITPYCQWLPTALGIKSKLLAKVFTFKLKIAPCFTSLKDLRVFPYAIPSKCNILSILWKSTLCMSRSISSIWSQFQMSFLHKRPQWLCYLKQSPSFIFYVGTWLISFSVSQFVIPLFLFLPALFCICCVCHIQGVSSGPCTVLHIVEF